MTLHIGGPAPAAAPQATPVAQNGTAQAMAMARQAAALPRAETQATPPDTSRPLAYGVSAPLVTHETRAVQNEYKPTHRPNRQKTRDGHADDADAETGKNIDIKV
jgi:hypothetical protein